MRRNCLAVTLALVVTTLFACVPLSAKPDSSHRQPDHAHRAMAWYASLERHFAVSDDNSLYREHFPKTKHDHRYSYEWPFSQAHVAILDLAGLRSPPDENIAVNLRRSENAQQTYWTQRSRNGVAGYLSRVAPPLGPGADLYYDDNEWVGLAAVQHWLFFHDQKSLERAKLVFMLACSGWDQDRTHPSPGGIFWTQKTGNHDRNTVSNMPAAQLGVRLAQITGDKHYLRQALKFYHWTNRTFQHPDGLYGDHIDLKGHKDSRPRAYNQGVPVGVNVLLYHETGDPAYLAEAKRVADASYRYFILAKRIDKEPPAFAAIYFKNLLLLEATAGGHRYRDAMRAYADRMWSMHRDPQSGLFDSGESRAKRPVRLIDQAAMVQIAAVLAWNPKDYAKLY